VAEVSGNWDFPSGEKEFRRLLNPNHNICGRRNLTDMSAAAIVEIIGRIFLPEMQMDTLLKQ